jgi:predicted nucleotidyltransferase
MIQLFELFAKKSAMKILEFFMDNPSSEFYESELRKKLKIAKASSIKWLKEMVKCEFLSARTKGRIIFYKLNSDNVIIKELKRLKLISTIIPDFKKIADVEIYLYGSGARGEDNEESDVDLLVIGKKLDKLIEITGRVEKKLNRRVKISSFSQLEWSKMARKDPAFYERVEKDKIRLV